MTIITPTYLIADLEPLERLSVGNLTNDDAVALGHMGVELIQAWGLNLAVEIVLRDDVVFRAKLGNTGRDNDEWLTGKAAVTRLLSESSLLVKLRHQAAGTPFEERHDIDHSTHRAFGGCVPLRNGDVLIGTLTMSGEPDTVDHHVASQALKRYISATHTTAPQ